MLRLEENFYKVDTDGNGKLDLTEFCDVMLAYYAIKRSDAVRVFKMWDMDDSSGIDLEEWIFVMAKLERGTTRETRHMSLLQTPTLPQASWDTYKLFQRLHLSP